MQSFVVLILTSWALRRRAEPEKSAATRLTRFQGCQCMAELCPAPPRYLAISVSWGPPAFTAFRGPAASRLPWGASPRRHLQHLIVGLIGDVQVVGGIDCHPECAVGIGERQYR